MSVGQVQLAAGIARMLAAQGVSPAPTVEYAIPKERASTESAAIHIAPSDVETTTAGRDGDREGSQFVDIAVVQACQASETSKIEGLIATCESIAELAARNEPLDDSDNPIGTLPDAVNHSPLYSVERLLEGTFLGVVTLEYQR